MELTNINVIKDVLTHHGFHFSKSKGQNFLTAAWVPERIASECMADEDTAVMTNSTNIIFFNELFILQLQLFCDSESTRFYIFVNKRSHCIHNQNCE